MTRPRPVDLLLINASNMASRPIFPYAFVQVSAVARRFGVEVARFDFVHTPKARWRASLARLLRRYQPRMIGLHLRQSDTVVAADYLPPPKGDPTSYFLPVEETRHLVKMVRALTSVPIVMGGFAYSAQPLRTAEMLDVDFGVQSEPDGFLERFEDVLARRRLDRVPNLVWRQGRRFRANPRVFYPPHPGPEYDDTIIAELLRFYRGKPPPSVPVEFARGCPFRCHFCNEPAVKGRRLRHRAWPAIEQDLLLLERHGLRRVWMVCSEINARPAAALQLARHMAALNAKRKPARRFVWSSYNLPNMRPTDLRFMLDAGFEAGWNDFPSFDDRNLARCRVPFRSKTALAYYRTYLDWADAQAVPPKDRQTFFVFLGNAHVDAHTIRTTLRKVDRLGLPARHETANVAPATRVFEIDGKLSCGDRATLRSFGRKGLQAFDPVNPTFFDPPELVRHLGSPQAVREFLGYLASTFLSTGYQRDRPWSDFLRESMSQPGLLRLVQAAKAAGPPAKTPMHAGAARALRPRIERALARLWAKPSAKTLRPLFFPGRAKQVYHHVARALLIQLLRPTSHSWRPMLRQLGIPHDGGGFPALSPYRLAEILYRRYDSNQALLADLCRSQGFEPDGISQLALRFLLFHNDIRIRPEYRELLFG